MKKKLLLLICAFIWTLPHAVLAETVVISSDMPSSSDYIKLTENGLRYSTDGYNPATGRYDRARIQAYEKGHGSTLVIPDAINGVPVTNIEPGAFNDAHIVSLEIGANVHEISGVLRRAELETVRIALDNPKYLSQDNH